ncbi:hypothetical protein RclHR1_04110014 [Rhizophagus clarus]|uniref:Uncharacterized protein n=1 Tax=Rhizophagus clarus TaxID=94130 RepID=A0A2Z6RXV3_9GLOM|nr:hypothetical protein RclHR1_04110014 [Rhizophagus clarus]GES84416.1 hypothetical protein GLOIN_2v1786042 [Rhizophagus clarus]
MTHFSDFSFLARAVSDFCILVWAIMHIYNIDRFEALRWRVIKRKEVKSIMTILFLLSVTSLLIYDIICTKIKYTEGFVVDPLTKAIIGKPADEWSPENKRLRHIANRLLMLFYAMENSAVFLLQNFWNYLTNKIVKAQFITTWQFRINYLFIFITFVVFNGLPFFFEDDTDDELDYSNVEEVKEALRKHTYGEVIPELAAATCNLIVLVYALMAHFKFTSLIKQNNKNYIADRLKYYKHMNFLLILIVAFGAGLMFTFCIDGLSEKQYLNRNKFTADLFASVVNFFMATFWIVWLMIFYPRLVSTYNGKHNNDYSKFSTPLTSPTSESTNLPSPRKDKTNHKKSLSIKRIENKIDSTTTTNTDQMTYVNENYNYMNDDHKDDNNNNNYGSDYYNEGYNNLQSNGYVQLPSPLAINNKQIISYTGSPRKYENFV